MTIEELNAIRQIVREEIANMVRPEKEYNAHAYKRALLDFTTDKQAMNRYCAKYRLPRVGEE